MGGSVSIVGYLGESEYAVGCMGSCAFVEIAPILSATGHIFLTYINMVNGNQSLITSIDVYLMGIPTLNENKNVEEGGGGGGEL